MQFRAHIAQGGSPRSPFVSMVPRRQHDNEAGCRPFLILTAITFVTCVSVYFALSPLFSKSNDLHAPWVSRRLQNGELTSDCCRGTEHLELWGKVVKSGSNHFVNTSEECCNACKDMCPDDSPCLCNSWVFCGDRRLCKDKFGECWLKSQDDPLVPDVHDSNNDVMWTSGLVYRKDMGIATLETEYGSIRIKFLPDCAPISVAYLLELLKTRHCAGCQFYRAEGRGNIWDAAGHRINQSQAGPPYAVVQGTLEAEGTLFKEIPKEACPSIMRGTMGWIGGGPDFFISLANHEEWYPKYTVFAYVLPADMHVVEKLASLSTSMSLWSGVRVSVLHKFVSLRLKKFVNSEFVA